MQSYSEVPGVRPSMYEFVGVGHNSAHNTTHNLFFRCMFYYLCYLYKNSTVVFSYLNKSICKSVSFSCITFVMYFLYFIINPSVLTFLHLVAFAIKVFPFYFLLFLLPFL